MSIWVDELMGWWVDGLIGRLVDGYMGILVDGVDGQIGRWLDNCVHSSSIWVNWYIDRWVGR